jgi:hypothetical protein
MNLPTSVAERIKVPAPSPRPIDSFKLSHHDLDIEKTDRSCEVAGPVR